MDQPTKLSNADLMLIQKAQQGMAQAQAIFEFTRSHISQVYGLGPMDQFNLLTGDITRVKPDEPAMEADNGHLGNSFA